MAFSSTLHPVSKPENTNSLTNHYPEALMTLVLLSAFAAHQSKKALRKLKRKLVWDTIKMKITSFFRNPASISNRTLLYILLAVVLLAVVLINPLLALILAVLALILILLGAI
ncbi:MAG: hypothetical protein ACM3VS_10235 [Candidatus Dadabacteria bacterium]